MKAINFVTQKRIESKKKCFENILKEILEMLEIIKTNKIKIGLISNCFSEEIEVIKNCILYHYLDVCCLSFEMGIKKLTKEFLRNV